jgi:hypothetical protein
LLNDKAFDQADIYVYSFESPKLGNAQQIDELAGRMVDFLDSDGVLARHEKVIFLCHSMGGLVTRAFLLKVRPNPEKVPMVYFFATPTGGANIAAIGAIVSRNPQLRYMLPLKEEGYVGDLMTSWLATSRDPRLNYPARILSFCAYEKLNTYGVKIVERLSAVLLCNMEPRAVLADHFEIVKPADRQSAEPYVYFKSAYAWAFSDTPLRVAEAIGEAELRKNRGDQALGDLWVDRDWYGGEVASVGESPFFVVRQSSTPKIVVRSECGEEKVGEAVARVSLSEGETVVQAIPKVVASGGAPPSSASLLYLDADRAVIKYFIEARSNEARGAAACKDAAGELEISTYFVVRRLPLPKDIVRGAASDGDRRAEMAQTPSATEPSSPPPAQPARSREPGTPLSR